MRVVIDMQGAQTASRFRGIGRYTMGLVDGLVRNRGKHEIFLAVNGILSESIDAIRDAFADILPSENICVWYTPSPVAYAELESIENRKIAVDIYSSFILSLKPDVILSISMMEGYGDEFFCDFSNLKGKALLSCVIHDFMPLKEPDKYLSAARRLWYAERFAALSELDLFLTNSNFTYEETKKYIPQVDAISISSGSNACFVRKPIADEERALLIDMGIQRPFILYVGGLDERKNVDGLFAAFSILPEDLRSRYQLVIPCGGQPFMLDAMKKKAAQAGLAEKSVHLCKGISDERLCTLYNACELFVFPSKDEGFGLPVLEAMYCGAPVIASNAASIPEIIGFEDAMFDPFNVTDIAKKIERALTDEGFRRRLVENGLIRSTLFSWDISAKKAWNAFEKLSIARDHNDWNQNSLETLCARLGTKEREKNYAIANCLARTFEGREKPQLLVDIGDLARLDAKTGIQRVVRSIITEWIHNPPNGYDVKLVYAVSEKNGYLYAHSYLCSNFNFDDGLRKDTPIDFGRKDVFIGIDLQAHIVPFQMPFLRHMHRHGVKIFFVVHDILPISLPEYFSEGTVRCFPEWLKSIGEFDGISAVSISVMNDIRKWMKKNGPKRKSPLKYSWFHLGSDIENSIPTKNIPQTATVVLQAIVARPSFLMVSTVEPRKGHRQTLDAFEQLWSQGKNINLIIVGKLGWKMNDFAERLIRHSEYGKRLFWLQGISDEYLDQVYEASSAVFMASEGEGFDLAIVEGAYHKKPLILRDIPVFREIAGENAFYFSSLDGEDLAQALNDWLALYAEDKAPSSEGIRYLTWEESAKMLLSRLPLSMRAEIS